MQDLLRQSLGFRLREARSISKANIFDIKVDRSPVAQVRRRAASILRHGWPLLNAVGITWITR